MRFFHRILKAPLGIALFSFAPWHCLPRARPEPGSQSVSGAASRAFSRSASGRRSAAQGLHVNTPLCELCSAQLWSRSPGGAHYSTGHIIKHNRRITGPRAPRVAAYYPAYSTASHRTYVARPRPPAPPLHPPRDKTAKTDTEKENRLAGRAGGSRQKASKSIKRPDAARRLNVRRTK